MFSWCEWGIRLQSMKVDESSNYLISLFGHQLSYTFVQCILCSPIEFETSQQLKATGNLLQVRPADFSNFRVRPICLTGLDENSFLAHVVLFVVKCSFYSFDLI